MIKRLSHLFNQKDRGYHHGGLRIISLVLAALLIGSLIFSLDPSKPAIAAGPFSVNTTNDTHDANTGDGICADVNGACSLRAALEQANASGGSTTINLPAGTYNLTLGDLIAGTQANTNITIDGAGASSTTIHQTQAGLMIFNVNFNFVDNVVFSLNSVTVTGGSENENDPNGFDGNGGAILAGGPTGNSVSLNGDVFAGNYCSPVINAGCTGGAISMSGGGILTVTDSTFSGNIASKNSGFGGGGAIYYDNGGTTDSVSITGSTFTNNVASNPNGVGGAIFLAGGSGSAFTVENNTFTGNSATDHGGAIYQPSGSLTASFNRIVGNSSNDGSGLFVGNNSGTASDATNNWWGCNSGPGATPCDTAVLGSGSGATFTTSPWIILSNTANPATISTSQTSTLTADFLHNSTNGTLTTAQISQLINLPVTWGSAVLGTLSGQQTTIQANGTATATFTAGSTAGLGSAIATVDSANAKATISIQQPPAITSGNSATFLVGAAGSFTVTTTGFPLPTISETGSLPSGVTFTNNGDGTATLAGTPSAGTGGVYQLTINATNGVAPDASQSFTLTVNEAPSITSANNATFTVNTAGTFTVTTNGYPKPTLAESGALPGGVSFTDNGDGTGKLAGTPASTGSFPITFTAHNSSGPDAIQSFTLSVNQAPSITSANNTSFTEGQAGTFTVTTSGFPAPSLSESGALPSGVTFTNNGDGTGALAGTPALGTSGTYLISFTAQNGVTPDATQNFTLTVQGALAITSANSTTFVVGTPGTFTVTTTGTPIPTISETGSLPGGVTFSDNGDGTATLAGTPSAGMGGTYPLTITAHNGVAPDATQSFTLTVNQAPVITSANSTSFTEGTAGTFTVTSTGFPVPSLAESGALPSGVTFTDNGDGTGTLAGTPASGTHGTYSISFTASNGVGSPVTQSFTLTVNQPLAITSANNTTFIVGTPGSFTVTTTGSPTPSLAESGALPSGVSFKDNGDGTGTLSGTPAAGTGGTYAITFTAHNGVVSDVTQNFSLTVNEAPAITSGNSTSFTVGSAGSFTVTTSGFPKPSLAESGSLPSGVTFVDNGNGTGKLSGTPATGTAGTYPITFTAHNGVGSDATQSFTLTVLPIPTTLTIAAPVTTQYSDPINLSATVSPVSVGGQTATGTVEFFIAGTSVGTASIDSSGVALLTGIANSRSAGNYAVTATFTSSNPQFAGSSASAVTQVVSQENAFIQYTGDTIAQVGTNLNLRATAWDSAASGFPGTNTGTTNPDTTIGDITKMWIEFDIYSAGSCGSGTPVATPRAQVSDTGTIGDGIGTATTTFTSSNENSYCVISRLVANGSGGTPNLYYAALDAQAAGFDFYQNSGQFADGGGWIVDPNGSHGNFGFNARYNKNGQPQGQVVYIFRGLFNGVMADFIIKSNSLSGLMFSGSTYPITATLQGKASIQVIQESNGATLFSSGNATFTASVTDSGKTSGVGSDAFSLTVYDKNGVLYKTVPTSLLQGGNVIIHSK